MKSAKRVAAASLAAACLMALSLVTPPLASSSRSATGWRLPQQAPPRVVGDVTRDGAIRASDALAVLAHVVGEPLPPSFRVDPDGDVACRGNVSRLFREPDGQPLHPLDVEQITAQDALWILSHVVGRELPDGLWPAGHCAGFQNDPEYVVLIEPFADSILVVEGGSAWEWIIVGDTVNQIYPWQSVNVPSGESALAGLLRARSDDSTVARLDTISEWSHALGQFRGVSPGVTDVYVEWFDSEDTVRVVVLPWEPTHIQAFLRQVPGELHVFFDTLRVADTTRVHASARDANSFSRPLGGDTLVWQSRSPQAVEVGADGHVTALAEGSSWVVASWAGFADSVQIHVISTAEEARLDVSRSFGDWWAGINYDYPGPALSTAADDHTASWGNFGMRDAGHEPRQPFGFQADAGFVGTGPEYVYHRVGTQPWDLLYLALAAARNGVLAADAGAFGEDEARFRAFAKFVQGISLGYLALLFDQAIPLTEGSDPGALAFVPYPDVMDQAVAALDAAVAIAALNTISIPGAWMYHTEDVGGTQLAELALSYKARFLASVGRTPEERAGGPWSTIAAAAESGITADFAARYDGAGLWGWKRIQLHGGGAYDAWSRLDYRTVGPADASGAWQTWMARPVHQRTPFVIDTDDRRVVGADGGDGLYVRPLGWSPFRPERGIYNHSYYLDIRFEPLAANAVGAYVEFPVKELDFLRAEAAYRQGDFVTALNIVNTYRANGELPAITDPDVVPGGDRCVPKRPDGSCGDLWDALRYEKRIEVYHYGVGTAFFDDRGWGDLAHRTYHHLPVPGRVLDDLGLPRYTFGGGQPLLEAGAPVAVPSAAGRAYVERLQAELRARGEDFRRPGPEVDERR